ncbi:MAG: N-acetylmuramoyl-L-alanine amidase [Alphaproteobacteria bacterium]|nr:N-acetylmuramoyl-L-alanine amidase [Alphaproteobacteria bacterium]
MGQDKSKHIMNRREFLFSSSCFLCFLAMPFKKAVAGIPSVTGSRVGINGDKTRFVIDLSKEIDSNIFILKNPDRIVVDFPQIEWRLKEAQGKGLIKKYRFARFNKDTYRLVLDLTKPAMVYDKFILPASATKGPRLVLDLKETKGAASSSNFSKKTTIKKPIKAIKETADTKVFKKKVITIDPGHGGVDPGAIGVGGVYEKTLTLAAGKEVKKQLEATGRYKVHLTRSSDKYLKLWKRVVIARKHKSDLFISIHADSLKDRRVKGASIYTLAEKASDARAAKLAAKENKADLIFDEKLEEQPKEVANILLDLKRRETLNSSKIFANGLISKMKKNKISLLGKNHRYAAFAVLKAPDVPSILVEMGFLSNREEVKLLKSSSYRTKIAKTIVEGVDKHFS